MLSVLTDSDLNCIEKSIIGLFIDNSLSFDEDYEEKVEEYAKSIVSSEIKSHNQQYASVDCYTGTIEKKSEDRYVVNGKAYIDDKYGELYENNNHLCWKNKRKILQRCDRRICETPLFIL